MWRLMILMILLWGQDVSKLSDQIRMARNMDGMPEPSMIRAWAEEARELEKQNRLWMDTCRCLLKRLEAIDNVDEAKPEEFSMPQQTVA